MNVVSRCTLSLWVRRALVKTLSPPAWRPENEIRRLMQCATYRNYEMYDMEELLTQLNELFKSLQ